MNTWKRLGRYPRLRRLIVVYSFFVVAAMVLLVGAGVKMASSSGGYQPANASTSLEGITWEGVSDKPDIYLIIPDGYPGEDTLSTHFGYNNSGFIEELEGRGFYVVEDSYASYPRTCLTLTGMLSMEYVELDEDGYPIEPLNYFDYEVWHQLEKEDYTFIHVGSGWGGTKGNAYADVNLVWETLSGWETYWRTAWMMIAGQEENWREILPFQFDMLGELPCVEVSTFTVAHSLGFHAPYIFAADGGPPGPGSTTDLKLGQLQYTNKLLLDVVDSIIQNSDTPPIILIVSDTGPFTSGERYSDARIRARLDNLEAFYLPGLTEEERATFGSQVNIFRLLFNYYFDGDYEILPDRYFYIVDWDEEQPRRLVEITELIEGDK